MPLSPDSSLSDIALSDAFLPDFRDLDLKDKKVLLRVDLNVPVLVEDPRGQAPSDQSLQIEPSRIKAVWPTLQALLQKGAQVIVLSHWGRPTAGRPEAQYVPELSLRRLIPHLEKHWPGVTVRFVDHDDSDLATPPSQAGQVTLLENLRFNPGEEGNDQKFAAQLAAHGDLYINDAFSVSHRAHASIVGIPSLLPTYAGLQMRAEIEALHQITHHPRRPVLALVGGSKISTKIDVVLNLTRTVDVLALGGAMVHPFWQADGTTIGRSKTEDDVAEMVQAIKASALKHGCRLLLPDDGIAAQSPDQPAQSVDASAIPEDMMVLDMGPRSVERLCQVMQECATVVWNGPLGMFEKPPFDQATAHVARAIASLSPNVFAVAGGGDTVAALQAAGGASLLQSFAYISTAGGAFLEWLEGKGSPGVQALYRSQP